MATVQQTNTKSRLQAEFARLEGELTNGAPTWLAEKRRQAIARFEELDFPHVRQEAWRFTSLRPLDKIEWKTARDGDTRRAALAVERHEFAGLETHQVVLVDGMINDELTTIGTLPKGVQVCSIDAAVKESPDLIEQHLGAMALNDDHPFLALNTAMFAGGTVIVVPRSTVVEKPIHLVNLATGGNSVNHPRTLVLVGEASQATVIETFASIEGGVYLTNAVTEFALAASAVVDHIKIQRESDQAFHVAVMTCRQDRDSTLTSHNVSLGGALVRNDIGSLLDDEGIHCDLSGLNMISGTQHVDNHTLLSHAKPHCTSHQLYKSILDGKSTAVFNGRIHVHQDAQKTDAIQSNHSLLLSDEATAHSQPNLEIFADDVKCTHGATIGNVADAALFYMRTRGIDKETARTLLTYAYANEVLTNIKLEAVREKLEKIVFARFNAGLPMEELP
jgi:Fe-S cluster assembly protein SufD